MKNLPRDLIRNILSFLRIVDLLACRLVCKTFLLESDKLPKIQIGINLEKVKSPHNLSSWSLDSRNKVRSLSYKANTQGATIHDTKKTLALFPNLKRLCFFESFGFNVSQDITFEFLQQLPHSLTCLELTSVRILYPQKLELLPTLKTLLLRRLSITDSELIFLNKLTILSKLSLISIRSINGEFIQYLSTSIRSLKLWFNEKISNIQHITSLRYLKTLDISEGEVTTADIKYIPRSTKKLILYDLPKLTNEVLLNIPPHLEFFEILANVNLDGIDLPNTIQVLHFSNCSMKMSSYNFPPKLKRLFLSHVSITDQVNFSRLPSTLQKIVLNNVQFPFSALLDLPKSISFIALIVCDVKDITKEFNETVAKFSSEDRHVLIQLEFIKEGIDDLTFETTIFT